MVLEDYLSELRIELADLIEWGLLASTPAIESEPLGISTSEVSDPTYLAAIDPESARVRAAVRLGRRTLADLYATSSDLRRAIVALSDAMRGQWELLETTSRVAPDREHAQAITQRQHQAWLDGVRSTRPMAAPVPITRQERLRLIEENAKLQRLSRASA